MNDIVTDLKLIQIDSVPLSESKVGKNINERFSNIDKNFQTIINSEYLKGQTGDGIYAKECSFDKDSKGGLGIYKGDQLLTSGKLYQLISECILTGVEYSQLSNERIPKGKIVLIYQNVDDRNILISSLPYVFIDEAYLSGLRAEGKPNPNEDLSCIVYFENGNFIKSSNIPKIYYNNDAATFCWKINGIPTQLPAQGPKGDDGKQGLSIYYAECEYNKQQYKLTSIFDPENGKYVDTPDITSTVLENGSLILAYVIKSDSNTVAINDIILGTYDAVNGIIKNNVKLNIPDISELMKNNPDNALYVNAGLNQNKNVYHSTYSVGSDGSDYRDTLQIGLVEGDNKGLSQLDKKGKLISNYQDNSFNNVEINGELKLSASNKPTIQSNQNNQNNIQITVGNQTSDEFTVPFATKATAADTTESAKHAESATTAKKIEDKPVLAVNNNKQIQITVGGQTSDSLTVPFAKYSGYSINPIVISAQNNEAQLQPNKINYIWITNGGPSELQLSLPVLDDESYVDIPDTDNQCVGICQCVLLVDANIQLSINWEYNECNTQYSIDSSLLKPSTESGIKEIIFTGYWNKSNDQTNVIWLVGGDTYQLETV